MCLVALAGVVLCAGCAGTGISDDVLEIARSTMRAGAFHIAC
jgi:hypothetical protein